MVEKKIKIHRKIHKFILCFSIHSKKIRKIHLWVCDGCEKNTENHDNTETLKEILNQSDKHKLTLLHLSVVADSFACTELLLKLNCNVNTQECKRRGWIKDLNKIFQDFT